MTVWISSQFTVHRITQYPAGPHLEALQSRFVNVLMLMFDEWVSKNGEPVIKASEGSRQFVQDAVAAKYTVGALPWNSSVVDFAEPTYDGRSALKILSPFRRRTIGIGLDASPQVCHRALGQYAGDRVVALFGDGDLSPKSRVLDLVSAMKTENIQFVTRGIGSFAVTEFAEIPDENAETVLGETVEQSASGNFSKANPVIPTSTVIKGR